MEPFALFGGLLALVAGLIGLIMFAMLCWNIGLIRKNSQSIYAIEVTRGVKEGIVNAAGQPIRGKPTMDTTPLQAVASTDAGNKAEAGKHWSCPACGHDNFPGYYKCEQCGTDRPEGI